MFGVDGGCWGCVCYYVGRFYCFWGWLVFVLEFMVVGEVVSRDLDCFFLFIGDGCEKDDVVGDYGVWLIEVWKFDCLCWGVEIGWWIGVFWKCLIGVVEFGLVGRVSVVVCCEWSVVEVCE